MSAFTNASPKTIPHRASIIFIQCHGLGYGDLSCYGQTNFQTPNLDRLAAEGIRFTNYQPASREIRAAQTALMTGMNSGSVSGAITVAERLQQNGYHTGLVGEWTLGPKPWTQGFDEFGGFVNDDEARNYFADQLWSYQPNYSFNEPTGQWVEWKNGDGPHNGGPEMVYPNTGGRKEKYMPEFLTSAMCNFVRINQPDMANEYRPFFLLVNLPAPRSAKPGKDDFPVPTDAPFSDEPWPQAAKNRVALITRLDSGIGRLFEQLDKEGMTNNVVIFFSSSAAPEKFADRKMDFLKPNGNFAAATNAPPRLPMIVRWLGGIPAGQVSKLNWSGADFVPTALAIAYVKPVKGLDGISILPVLRGGPGTNSPPLRDIRDLPVPVRQF
ncbi:MAG TPA: sulfatase-like hydrolase/transferase [Verrucomicrobiae bacterium]